MERQPKIADPRERAEYNLMLLVMALAREDEEENYRWKPKENKDAV